MKKILVCGAGGFIGTHLVTKLKQDGHYVIGADLKQPEFSKTDADEFHIVDLRDSNLVHKIITHDLDEVYQLAADMGGAGYIFTGDNDADILHNSASINLNVLDAMRKKGVKNVFYTSSACIYPHFNQVDPSNPNCEESSAYPAEPDSEYGWEKLFSERLYLSYAKNYGFRVRIARLHNVFGPLGSWNNGKEKAPAALCRKVCESTGVVKVWGSGTQTRSFLFIEDCIEGIQRIMASNIPEPLNLGSARMISINDLTKLIASLTKKDVTIENVSGPQGVMGRNSDNTKIQQLIGWQPKDNLEYGLEKTYAWIEEQLKGPWIYESPDGGKTRYRRRFGDYKNRELITE
jgi:nucleoside-diphosphate-sugar epimerase